MVVLVADPDTEHARLVEERDALAAEVRSLTSERDRDLVERQHNQRRLEEVLDSLEEQVETRTAELQRTNDELQLEIAERSRVQAALVVARDAANEASRAKSRFLANMSHEMRTPLNAIIGYAGLLEEDAEALGNATLLGDLQKVSASAHHLLGLITDVLDLAEIEVGRTTVSWEDVHVAAQIDHVVDRLQPRLQQSGNALSVEVAQDVGVVRSDGGMLRQVLSNLLDNALKFTLEGEIRLHARREDLDGEATLVVSVSDTGVGIGPEQLGRLFQPFAQADESTTRRHGGMGLGLTICRYMCEMLGGSMTAESAVGHGSTFEVALPIRPAQSAST